MEESKQGRKFSPSRLIGLGGVVFAVGGTIVAGGGWQTFLHIPSLAIICGITFFLLLACFGNDFLRFIPDSLATLVSTNAKPNPRFAEIALFGSRYVSTFFVLQSARRSAAEPGGLQFVA